ncbi:hypothetical protein QYF36_019728 [Acer negundo]|nr:hypothetical protein QYF36_019728 [Acer negundo]
MANKGCSPDVVSYTTIVSSMCKLGKVEEARELASRFEPIVSVYNVLINGLCKERKLEETFQLLGASGTWNRMIRNGCHPNVVAYTS